MSSKFGRIRPRTKKLAALKNSHRLIIGENDVITFSRLIFIGSFSKDIHKSLDEFDFWPDPTTE